MALFSCSEFVCVFNLNSEGIVSKQEGTVERIDHVLFKTNTYGRQYKNMEKTFNKQRKETQLLHTFMSY